MEFFRRVTCAPARLGVFPGAFNPLTVAHIALGRAALHAVDEVLFVLPRVFPHKPYHDASLDQRLSLLMDGLVHEPNFSIAVSDRGLFVEIARECREAYGPAAKLSFLCGRDAAERIAGWDYGRPGAWQEMLLEFDLLVAPRQGEYLPAPGELGSFGQIPVEPGCDAISASEVRRRIAAGEPWEDLVPQEIRDRVREFYT